MNTAACWGLRRLPGPPGQPQPPLSCPRGDRGAGGGPRPGGQIPFPVPQRAHCCPGGSPSELDHPWKGPSSSQCHVSISTCSPATEPPSVPTSVVRSPDGLCLKAFTDSPDGMSATSPWIALNMSVMENCASVRLAPLPGGSPAGRCARPEQLPLLPAPGWPVAQGARSELSCPNKLSFTHKPPSLVLWQRHRPLPAWKLFLEPGS